MVKKSIVWLSILFILGCSAHKEELDVENDVWPYEYYEQFNLRTVFSYFTPYVKNYCNTYPKDFFTKEQVFMPNTNKVVMENSEVKLSFEIYSHAQVLMQTESKDGQYSEKNIYSIIYDEKHKDYRVSGFYFPRKENCFYYITPDDNETDSLN